VKYEHAINICIPNIYRVPDNKSVSLLVHKARRLQFENGLWKDHYLIACITWMEWCDISEIYLVYFI